MKQIRSLATLLVVCGIAMAPARLSHAEPLTIKDESYHGNRPTKLDLVAGFGFFGYLGFAGGGWYSLPVMPDGFLPKLNDSFNVEAGAVFEYGKTSSGLCDYSYTSMVPMGGVRWDFYLTKDWTVFGKLKAGMEYKWANVNCMGFNDSDAGGFGGALDTGVGAYWNFGKGMALRLDAGYPRLSAGLSIDL